MNVFDTTVRGDCVSLRATTPTRPALAAAGGVRPRVVESRAIDALESVVAADVIVVDVGCDHGQRLVDQIDDCLAQGCDPQPRVDQQIGIEDTPDAWCARLVEVFREVRRVLRPANSSRPAGVASM